MKKTRVTKAGKIKLKEKDIEKAIKDSQTKRRKKRIIFFALPIIAILVFIVLQFWDSPEKMELTEMAAKMTPAIKIDKTRTAVPEQAVTDVLDKGVPCSIHQYILAPGANENLKFEVKLDREVLQLAHLLKNKVEDASISLASSFDKWEQQGIRADVQSHDLETITGKADIWVVQAGDLLADYAKAVRRAGSAAPAGLEKIAGHIARTTRFEVAFFGEDYGVISTLGRYNYSEAKVGELLENDINEKLGGALTIPYSYEGKNYNLPIEKKEVENFIYFLNLNININLPSQKENKITDCESSFTVKINETPDINFTIKVTYEPRSNEFQVSGPAFAAECYKPGKNAEK